MLIPVGTDVRLRRPPVANIVLIGLNVLVFLAPGMFETNFWDVALPPLNGAVPMLHEYVTYQFRHGDFGHLAGNMLFLWVFGNAVCDRMGPWAYVTFYLSGGVFAGVAFTAFNTNPLIGASGSIAAVTTAFLVLYPRVHITLLFWLVIVTLFQIPAMWLIVLKIILWDNMIAPSFGHAGMQSSVAYSAHLGGYAFGFAAAMLMLATRGLPRNQFDMLALWRRWSLRQGLPTTLGGPAPSPARTPSPWRNVPDDAPKESPQARSLREDVLSRMLEGDWAEAARLYQELSRLPSSMVLPRTRQLEIANYLAQQQQHSAAIEAYQRYLDAYPTAHDAPQVRLLLGLVFMRRQDYRSAAEHLERAVGGLSVASQRDLALQELALARAALGQSDNTG